MGRSGGSLRLMFLAPGVRVGAHVEVFKEDERTGEKVLVHTSRPCATCGQPLDGVIIPRGKGQVHAVCPEVPARAA